MHGNTHLGATKQFLGAVAVKRAKKGLDDQARSEVESALIRFRARLEGTNKPLTKVQSYRKRLVEDICHQEELSLAEAAREMGYLGTPCLFHRFFYAERPRLQSLKRLQAWLQRKGRKVPLSKLRTG